MDHLSAYETLSQRSVPNGISFSYLDLEQIFFPEKLNICCVLVLVALLQMFM